MSVCEEDQQGKYNDACKQDTMMCARACKSSTPRYKHLNRERTRQTGAHIYQGYECASRTHFCATRVHAFSRDVLCCGVANDSFISLVANRLRRIVHYIVGVLGSLTTHYDGHSRVKVGGPGQSEVVTDTPKDLLVACCKINHASLTN